MGIVKESDPIKRGGESGRVEAGEQPHIQPFGHFMHDGDALPLSVAVGVAMIGAEDEPESIMARADEEMYRRKAAA